MYKNVDDPEKIKQKNEEIDQVKKDTEVIKQEKLKEAQDTLVKQKEDLQKEKQEQLSKIKSDVKMDEDEEYEYVDMNNFAVEEPKEVKSKKISANRGLQL